MAGLWLGCGWAVAGQAKNRCLDLQGFGPGGPACDVDACTICCTCFAPSSWACKQLLAGEDWYLRAWAHPAPPLNPPQTPTCRSLIWSTVGGGPFGAPPKRCEKSSREGYSTGSSRARMEKSSWMLFWMGVPGGGRKGGGEGGGQMPGCQDRGWACSREESGRLC